MRAGIPEPRYECAGADASMEEMLTIHQGGQDAHHRARDLFHAHIIDDDFQQEAQGFFCERCLTAYDLVADQRTTLQAVIRERMGDAAAAAAGIRE